MNDDSTHHTVELRGLEPLTFSLRRHGVDLIRREHRAIDVQVAAAGAPWLHRGGTWGTRLRLSLPRATETHAVPLASGSPVGIPGMRRYCPVFLQCGVQRETGA